MPTEEGEPSRPSPSPSLEARRRARRYRARHRRGRSSARKLLLVVHGLVTISLIAAVSAFGYAEWRLNQIRRVHIRDLAAIGKGAQSSAAPSSSAGPPMTILIVGSDSRAALAGTASAGKYGSAAEVGGARSDTIILARLVPATKRITLLSIPRDLWLPIAGLGHQKINAALGVSPDLLIQTIHDQFGIDINHYVDIDFQSFKDIADAVGGVSIYFPTPARDAFSLLNVPVAGCTNLVGDQALGFVRSREYQYYLDGYWHQESLSDLARIQRQQMFIRKMVSKAEAVGLGNPFTLNRIIGGVTRNVTVDDSLSTSAMINLAKTFRSVDGAAIQGLTLPTYAETLPGPNDVLMPEEAADKAMITQFLGTTQLTPSGSGAPTASTLPVLDTTTTTTTTATGSTTPSSNLSPYGIEVRVDNGSGVGGQAALASSELRRAGFSVIGTGTANSYGYTQSVVEYGYGHYDQAATLASAVGGGATLEEVSGLGSALVLVTGHSFSGIGTPAAAGSGDSGTTAGATSTSSSVESQAAESTTTVPSTTTTTYVLPGTPAGSTTPSC